MFYLNIILSLILGLIIIINILISVAFFTLIERKVLSIFQRRKGPNVVGFAGFLQAFSDGLKLFLKELILPTKINKILYIISPIITLFLSLIIWIVIPFSENIILLDINLGLLYILAISSLNVYGIILAGWTSNSKYSFLGALRSAAQMISYEISIGIIIICIILCVGSLNLTKIIEAQKTIWFIIPLFPLFIMFFISSLAETNRPPFDLPEAEGELVAGYNIEYSAMGFAFFFIAEYANILLMSNLIVILFLGGWLPFWPFNYFGLFSMIISYNLKLILVIFLFIWVRGAFPRYRYDQLMYLGWKVFLPLSLSFLILISSLVYFIN